MTSDSEAQSEAPSVLDKILFDVYMIGRADATLKRDDYPVLIPGIKAKINRLITEARIDELKQLLGRQWWADNQHHEDEVVPYHHIEAQIKQLSNNLSKGKV